MFGDTWRWAGRYRTRDTNIGAAWERIPERVRELCGDASYQRAHGVYPVDAFVARFHHRLVQIHPFPNGNGRHARLIADLLLADAGRAAFTWGAADLGADGGARAAYLAALRAADGGDYDPLLEFVRS